jgi:hypothetical protein
VPAGASVDCERILESWWGQPVNTSTALAFVVAGILVYIRGATLPTSGLIAGVGAGSIAFHGPMPSWGELLHDLTIGWVLVWVVLVETERRALWPYAFGGVALLMLTPQIADPIQAVLAVAAVVIVWRNRHPHRLWMLGLLALGGVVGRLSRTGEPWCHPDSIWQGHGFWHLASAVALALWAGSPRPRSDRELSGSAFGPGPVQSE